MFLFDKILLGPFRILLLFLGVLFVHQLIVRQPLKNYGMDYLLKRMVFLGSTLVLLIFALIQLNMYDIFSILAIFLITVVLRYLDIRSSKTIAKTFTEKKRNFLLSFFKFMERKLSLHALIGTNSAFFYSKKLNHVLFAALLVSLATFVSRFLFLKNDLYTLSSLWIKKLEVVKSFNSNVWFTESADLLGELALINFYAKITGVSEEMAMHSFGLLESFSLSIVLYWIILKLTEDRFIAPMIGVLFFGFFYKYMPINVNLLLEHNSLYLALGLALPALLFSCMPQLISVQTNKYVLFLSIVFAAITFTNFFVALILVPIFLIVALLLSTRHNRSYTMLSIASYIIGAGGTLILHALGCLVNNRSFLEFMRSSMILVDSYTYFPQLALPPSQLTMLFYAFCMVAILFLLPLLSKNNEKWRPALIFLVFAYLVVTLRYLQLTWLDMDLYYESLSPLMVIVAGIFIGMLVHYLKVTLPKNSTLKTISIGILFMLMVLFAYTTNGFFNYDYKEIDELKADILEVYDDLSSDNMPFSYAIVNQNYGQYLSKNEHHFINYSDFLQKYPVRDSVYQLKKDDKLFLEKNPDYILPESVFVFITKTAESENKYNLATSAEVSEKILSQITILKGKGREISIFYEDAYLSVYEIVNKKNASNLNDLIFNL